MAVYWDAARCSLVEIYWCFRGYCLHYSPDDDDDDDDDNDDDDDKMSVNYTRLYGVTYQKTAIFIFAAIRKLNSPKMHLS
jgi:hypothetical protein